MAAAAREGRTASAAGSCSAAANHPASFESNCRRPLCSRQPVSFITAAHGAQRRRPTHHAGQAHVPVHAQPLQPPHHPKVCCRWLQPSVAAGREVGAFGLSDSFGWPPGGKVSSSSGSHTPASANQHRSSSTHVQPAPAPVHPDAAHPRITCCPPASGGCPSARPARTCAFLAEPAAATPVPLGRVSAPADC